ncbi:MULTISPECIES: hypothetical protein [Bifidobacterium]|nr:MULTISPECIES: hypothetical protein [Bifidobacterium]MDH7881693.1 hypothetical protein [Bifidobacterium catenulatum subsp. kashiwanohense]
MKPLILQRVSTPNTAVTAGGSVIFSTTSTWFFLNKKQTIKSNLKRCSS